MQSPDDDDGVGLEYNEDDVMQVDHAEAGDDASSALAGHDDIDRSEWGGGFTVSQQALFLSQLPPIDADAAAAVMTKSDSVAGSECAPPGQQSNTKSDEVAGDAEDIATIDIDAQVAQASTPAHPQIVTTRARARPWRPHLHWTARRSPMSELELDTHKLSLLNLTIQVWVSYSFFLRRILQRLTLPNGTITHLCVPLAMAGRAPVTDTRVSGGPFAC